MKSVFKICLFVFLFNNLTAQITSKTSSYKELLFNNQFQDAIVLIKKEIQNNSNDYNLHYYCGYAYKSLYQFDSAIVHLDKSLKIDNTKTEALNSLASCYSSTGMYEDAVRIYEKILNIDKNDFSAMNKLASLFIELNNSSL